MSPFASTMRVLTAGLLVLGFAADAARSESPKALPSEGSITSSGYFKLEQDSIARRDVGIAIEADDVTLDLGGHILRLDAEARPGTYGVMANRRKNVRIVNGSIAG